MCGHMAFKAARTPGRRGTASSKVCGAEEERGNMESLNTAVLNVAAP